MLKKLGTEFYIRNNVLDISKDLLGKILVTHLSGKTTSGRIVECEAYAGEIDNASHASGGRRTPRTEIMFGHGGTAYIYLCYGIHHMFNVVTNEKGIPHAILIRALEPIEGIDTMLERTGKEKPDASLTRGPGNVGKALGLHSSMTGYSLQSDEIFIADDGFRYPGELIKASPRIGVDYAGDHARWPFRFYIAGHENVSGKPRK